MKRTMMNRRLIIWICAAVAALPLAAQNDLNKEVTVTRAYEPSVSESFKMGLTPDMVDTTKIRPEFNYEVTPYPLDYGFAVSPIRPVNFNTVDSRIHHPFYVKLGVGGPFQSIAEASYGSKLDDKTTVGAIIKHYGQYSKIKNDANEKAPAQATFNNASLFADRKFGDDLFLSGKFDYSYNSVTRYGYYNYNDPIPVSFDTSRKGLAQFYHDLGFGLSVGNSFADLSKFNFKVGASFDFFGDKFKYDEFLWKVGTHISIPAGYTSQITVDAGYDKVKGTSKLKNEYSDEIFLAGLGYQFDNGTFRFSLGGQYAYYSTEGMNENQNKFLPKINLELDLFDGYLTPYAFVTGNVQRNDYRSLSKINPYVLNGSALPTTVEYSGRVGARGLLFDILRYDISGGFTRNDDFHFFVNHYDLKYYGNVFTALTDKAKIWDGKIALDADFQRSFNIYASARFYKYKLDNFDDAGDRPDLEVNFGVKYKYRNLFFIDLGMTLWGERIFYEYQYNNMLNAVKSDNLMDLYVNIDSNITKEFGVFVTGRNLLNKKLYMYNHYPMLGVNVMGGIKFLF
ncbi:MAG: hypothetical protein LUF90_02920 [Rikenellaceae bacterium]|nr:hypothetical protein [Rikenellaceae bacterium]